MPRRHPYTAIGIRRVSCFRCEAPGYASWQVCADGRIYRPICKRCDAGINEVVLRYMRDPDAEAKIASYRTGLGLPPRRKG